MWSAGPVDTLYPIDRPVIQVSVILLCDIFIAYNIAASFSYLQHLCRNLHLIYVSEGLYLSVTTGL